MKFDQNPATGTGSENFVRLKNGESVRGVFRGEPFTFYNHWTGKKSEPCTGPGCSFCSADSRPRFRFRLSFVVREDNGNLVPKIFEQGAKVYETLKGLHESDYNLEKTILKITRQGTGLNDTVYTILPLPGLAGTVTDEIEKRLKAIALPPIDQFPSDDPHGSQGMAEQDVPF